MPKIQTIRFLSHSKFLSKVTIEEKTKEKPLKTLFSNFGIPVQPNALETEVARFADFSYLKAARTEEIEGYLFKVTFYMLSTAFRTIILKVENADDQDLQDYIDKMSVLIK